MAIEAEYYGETRNALVADPIIRDMAGGVAHIDRHELAYDDGSPRHAFMMAALREYQGRGGTIDSHIGGPAEAVLSLLKEFT